MDLGVLQQLAQKEPEGGVQFQAMMQEIGAFIQSVNDTLYISTMLEFLIYINEQEGWM